MAILSQSPVWPVHKARRLHSQAQLSHLWHFMMDDENGGAAGDIWLLAQSLNLPGLEMNSITYQVGTMERYFLTTQKRGGAVTASFLELEGGLVDGFFRRWLDQASPLVPGLEMAGIRYSGVKYSRNPKVHLLDRNQQISLEFQLIGLLPKKLGTASTLTYNSRNVLTIPVEMVCDEVRRLK